MAIDSIVELFATAASDGATAAAANKGKTARWLWGIAAAGILGLGAYGVHEFLKEKPAKAPTEQRVAPVPQPK